MQFQLDPVKWLIAIAGFVNDWLFSRDWSKILLLSIPACLFLAMVGAVFSGSRMDRTKLRNQYIELGSSELKAWQEQIGQPTGLIKNLEQPESEEATTEVKNDESKTQLSSYAEMLFRRAHLLEPNLETQFVIGATLWQRGVFPNARQTLIKIAPADSKGLPAAHAFLAKMCQDEFVKTREPKLFEEFQHHALHAVEWPHTFPEVLIAEANLLWQQRKVAESIEYLQKAVKSQPALHGLLVERLRLANQPVLAQAARKEGIEHFQAELEKSPKASLARIQLAELHLLDPEGDAAAEELLTEGIKIQPLKAYSKLLSEVYRIRFARQAEQSKGKNVNLQLLDRALQADPNNARVAETIAALIRNGMQANEQMGAELNRVLASGQATTATHALLSEYHLQNGRMNEAKTHLEQVYRAAPMSVKYANNLAYLYAREKRFEEAEKIASQTLALLQANQANREPFIDELLDTLGMIYQAQQKQNDAISAYEASLKLNPNRLETRKRLVALYRKTGNEGVAKAHEEAVKRIELSKAEANSSSTTPKPEQPVDTSREAEPTSDK